MRRKQKTLRKQVLGWLFWPLLALWSVSSIIDYDIANRFVNLAYDRVLLESALDIGRQVKVLQDRIYVDLPEIAVQMLQSRDAVCDQQPQGAEDEQRQGVLIPALLGSRIDAAQAIEAALDGSEQPRQRLPVTFEDAEHIDAQRLRQRENHRREQDDL